MSDLDGAGRRLLDALDALPDPAWCEGIHESPSPIAIGLPDGDRRTLDAADLERWLLAHCEPAPFGDATGTRHDRAVRDTRRLIARDRATVFGFDPSSILPEIERELATDCRLAAELLDILVYTPGSKFLPHKDTPRHDDQLGTLIVELPHAHRGGEMTLVDGERVATVDWSRAVSSDPRDLQLLRWVALFGDVDHEIAPITSGTRITAVFTLRYRSDDRLPAPHRDRIDVLVDAAIALHDTDDHPTFAIPCSRMIVVPRDPEARYPLSPGVLRGADRLIAAALERASIAVSVRECIVLADDEEVPFVDTVEAAPDGEAILLNRPLPRDLLESANALSWHPDPVSSYDHTIAALEPYEDGDVPPYVWLVREHVRPPGESMSYSATGYFGNEYSERYVYRFAMIIATAVTA